MTAAGISDGWNDGAVALKPEESNLHSDNDSLDGLIDYHRPITKPKESKTSKSVTTHPPPTSAPTARKPRRTTTKERETPHFKSLKSRSHHPLAPLQRPTLDFRTPYPQAMDPYIRRAKLRACMICSIVRTQDDFLKEGCPNCPWLDLDVTTLDHSTSQVMEGIMAITAPERSWVAKWLKIDGFEAGTYAMKVTGQPSPEVLEAMEDRGQTYIPRDGSLDHNE